MRSWGPGKHGSTFGGNPVACAAAIATLDLVEDSLAENATRVGDHLQRGLAELQRRCPQIVDVRGRGLMIGIEFESHAFAHDVEQAAFRRGLLVLTCGERRRCGSRRRSRSPSTRPTWPSRCSKPRSARSRPPRA